MIVQLTPEGRKLADKAFEVHVTELKTLLKGLPATDRTAAIGAAAALGRLGSVEGFSLVEDALLRERRLFVREAALTLENAQLAQREQEQVRRLEEARRRADPLLAHLSARAARDWTASAKAQLQKV